VRTIWWMLALVVALGCIPLAGEEIQLKNGSKVTGQVIALNGDIFEVRTSYGDIKIPRSDLLSITFPENHSSAEDGSPDAVPMVKESLEGTNYVNQTGGFQLTMPDGWALAPELRGQSKDVVAALKSPDDTLFFLVTPEKFAGTIVTYRVLAETQYQAKFKDYEKLSETSVTLDGQQGLRLIWHAKNPAASDAPMKCLVYIVSYPGKMVRLSFLTLEPLFADALPSFEKIAASYRTIPQP
jgi:hypothetical protein